MDAGSNEAERCTCLIFIAHSCVSATCFLFHLTKKHNVQQLPLFFSADRSSCSWFHARLEIQNTPILCFFNWPNATVSQESHWITNSRESMQLKITQTSQRNSRSLHERERGGCCGGISTPPQYTPKLSHRIPQALQALLDTRLIGSVSE